MIKNARSLDLGMEIYNLTCRECGGFQESCVCCPECGKEFCECIGMFGLINRAIREWQYEHNNGDLHDKIYQSWYL